MEKKKKDENLKKTDKNFKVTRKEFIKKTGRFALITGPVLAVLFTSKRARADSTTDIP